MSDHEDLLSPDGRDTVTESVACLPHGSEVPQDTLILSVIGDSNHLIEYGGPLGAQCRRGAQYWSQFGGCIGPAGDQNRTVICRYRG